MAGNGSVGSIGGNRFRNALTRAVLKIACSIRAPRFSADRSPNLGTPGSFRENQARQIGFGDIVTRERFPWESFPGGYRAVSGHQQLGGFLPSAGAELHPGGVEIGVDRLRRDAEPLGDLLAAVAIDNIAEAVPLTIGEKVHFRSRVISPLTHRPSVTLRERLTNLRLHAMATGSRVRLTHLADCESAVTQYSTAG
jgi:hypothetical protein